MIGASMVALILLYILIGVNTFTWIVYEMTSELKWLLSNESSDHNAIGYYKLITDFKYVFSILWPVLILYVIYKHLNIPRRK